MRVPGHRALAQGSPQPLPGLCHLVPSAARGSDCPGPSQAADLRNAFSWLPSTVWSRDPPLDGSKTCGNSRAHAWGRGAGHALRAGAGGFLLPDTGPAPPLPTVAHCQLEADVPEPCATDFQLKNSGQQSWALAETNLPPFRTIVSLFLTHSWALGRFPGPSAWGGGPSFCCVYPYVSHKIPTNLFVFPPVDVSPGKSSVPILVLHPSLLWESPAAKAPSMMFADPGAAAAVLAVPGSALCPEHSRCPGESCGRSLCCKGECHEEQDALVS